MAERRVTGGRVRIIGGSLRGSRLEVPERPGLRPTADRVRETLFNWLQPVLPGARCLDAFAGSGALGLEAASRGAASVTLLEKDPGLAATLRGSVQRLRVASAEVLAVDALDWLSGAPDRSFDIVFLDPPFASALLDAALQRLPPWLAGDARIYLECAREQEPGVPDRWELLREGRTKEVRYALYRASDPGPGRR